ncbi:MAG: lipoprotein signal peptidase [Bacteroidetes bacterium HGW-Bacteroidetes-9]|nr:MAG: lipoprotein signal peptidase [Bacteroidetes bacterium HGW-Bacteroidetes-9]
MKKSLLIVTIVLIIDQAVKFWIKTSMSLGEEIFVLGKWFIIHFTENPGMAFGMQFAGDYGKLILSIFRIIAIIGILYYLYVITRKKAKTGLIVSLSLVLAGAIGNMIDSAFYGMIFSSSNYFEVARLFPAEGGYGTFLHGRVVDMFYFPIFQGFYPTWVPFVGGNEFIFFRPVFNIADSSITIGVLLMIIFQKQFFQKTADITISN